MRDADLLARQRLLIVRSQQLREALARDAGVVLHPLNRIGAAGTRLARWLQEPWLPAAALVSLLLAWRMRRSVRLALRLWGFWRSLRLWLAE